MGVEAADFLLRCELHQHSEDVRGVCAGGDGTLLTASRDKSVIVWGADDAGDPLGLSPRATLTGHQHFVTCVTWMPAGALPTLPMGAVVSGSRDQRVLLWDVAHEKIAAEMTGHVGQVMAVAATANGDVLSTSVDGTARVWRDGHCTQVLSGHEGSVLCVLPLPDGSVLTGGADKTIKQWAGGACTATWSGHTDSVRGLALLPGVGAVSGSHDFTLRVWTLDGVTVSELIGHTALVFQVACSAEGLIASGSEDNTARVWRADGSCLQTIKHPSCVWAVSFLPTATGKEDLATGCADAVARVWSQAPQRQASADAQAAYDASLERLAATAASCSQYPGASDGAVKVVREGGGGVAYGWSAAEGKWEKIGQVVDGPGTMTGGGNMYQGVQYDYVFDVELDAGPTRKLPFNRDQNPYEVAEKWLEEQGLPPDQKEQVVNFLVQNTGGAAAPLNPAYMDPYTGSGAYVPGGSTGFPMAGGGAPMLNADPYTGTAALTTAARKLVYVPHSAGMLTFESAQYDGIAKKLCEFNAVVGAAAVDEAALVALVDRLKADPAAAATLTEAELQLTDRLLQWPAAQLFPALDLVRLLVLAQPFAQRAAAAGGTALHMALAAAAAPPLVAASLLTALRLLANCARQPALHPWLMQVRAEVLDAYSGAAAATKSTALAMASVLVNYAVLAVAAHDAEAKLHTLSAAVALLDNPAADPEVLFRALVAIGTLIYKDKEATALARDMEVQAAAVKLSGSGVAKLVDAAKDIMMVFES